jgi:hypothetical protein
MSNYGEGAQNLPIWLSPQKVDFANLSWSWMDVRTNYVYFNNFIFYSNQCPFNFSPARILVQFLIWKFCMCFRIKCGTPWPWTCKSTMYNFCEKNTRPTTFRPHYMYLHVTLCTYQCI